MINQIHRKYFWTTLKSLYNGLVDIRIFMLSFFRKFYKLLGTFWRDTIIIYPQGLETFIESSCEPN